MVFDDLDCSKLFPDSIANEVRGIEVQTGIYKPVDLQNLISGQLGPNYFSHISSTGDICAHAHFIS